MTLSDGYRKYYKGVDNEKTVYWIALPMHDAARPEIAGDTLDLTQYSTIVIAHPIW